MYWVYVLQNSKTKELYFGYTADLKRRITEHNDGHNRSTKREGEWDVIYAELYRSQKDAKRRERKLKHHGSGKHELKKRISHSLYL